MDSTQLWNAAVHHMGRYQQTQQIHYRQSAVAITKGECIVGHLSKDILRICSMFLLYCTMLLFIDFSTQCLNGPRCLFYSIALTINTSSSFSSMLFTSTGANFTTVQKSTQHSLEYPPTYNTREFSTKIVRTRPSTQKNITLIHCISHSLLHIDTFLDVSV